MRTFFQSAVLLAIWSVGAARVDGQTLADRRQPTLQLAECRQVTFTSCGLTLSGSLWSPRQGGSYPAILLLSGSGRNDRTGNSDGRGSFPYLAEEFCERGFIVFAYDKRGVGRSQGSFEDSNLFEIAEDARAAAEFLHNQPFVTSVTAMGFSQGAMVGPIIASKTRVSSLILLGGPALPLHVMAVQQRIRELKTDGADPETIAAIAEQVRSHYEQDFSFSDPRDKRVRYLRYDPATALRKVTCPVFAFYGGRDNIVPPEGNVDAMTLAFRDAGNRDATVTVLPEMNHAFQRCKTGARREYDELSGLMDPGVFGQICEWIDARHRRAVFPCAAREPRVRWSGVSGSTPIVSLLMKGQKNSFQEKSP